MDKHHRIVKIADFGIVLGLMIGIATIVRSPWETQSKQLHGIAGSDPYIPPEQWIQDEYDPIQSDTWSCGILLYTFYTKALLWKVANKSDERWTHYLQRGSDPFPPIEKLPVSVRQILYRLLVPEPIHRMTLLELSQDEWFKSIEICTPEDIGSDKEMNHSHYGSEM